MEIAREQAMRERRHGILVTQHGYTGYTAAVSHGVDYGQTRTTPTRGELTHRAPALVVGLAYPPRVRWDVATISVPATARIGLARPILRWLARVR